MMCAFNKFIGYILQAVWHVEKKKEKKEMDFVTRTNLDWTWACGLSALNIEDWRCVGGSQNM